MLSNWKGLKFCRLVNSNDYPVEFKLLTMTQTDLT